jgi:hypothetical protein
MAGLRSYTYVLQQNIAIGDSSWVYEVSNLPSAVVTNQAKLIKAVTLPSLTSGHQSIRLHLVDAPSNRITWSEPLDKFILLCTEGFRFKTSVSEAGRASVVNTSRETANYLCKLVVSGISINGVQYHFFGHSNSQLKSRSCFLYASSKEDISKKVETMGDFSRLKSVAKKTKRLGLLFSGTDMGITLNPEHCEDIEDVERGNYNFTDGCGLISKSLAKRLVKHHNIAYRNRKYLPSVFQIRYRGYKGVLTLDHTLNNRIAVQFRKSMRKFQDAKDLTLSVVDYSKAS